MMSIPLPVELKNFIAERGLFEGFTRNDSPGYVVLWAVDGIPKSNADIEIETYAPGFLAFAGNGGGEILAFDAAGAVYMLPLVGMASDEAIMIASSFSDFSETFEMG
jgi:hypothetical protein